MARILIVDDRPVNRRFLVTLLGYFDHELLEAGDGAEALETIRTRKIDLVIADVLMPTMDGYAFVQRLRSEQSDRHLPVIYYTAADYEPQSRAMALACGVRHFLTKPAEPQVILAAVNEALGRGVADVSSPATAKFEHHMTPAPADPLDPDATVFIVDDDPAIRGTLSEIMTDAHLKVEAFATAREFLNNYEVKWPGCLIVDIRMPGMGGIALLERLRSQRIHIPAIILTGHGDMPAAIDALRLRVLDFLEKPVDRRILLTTVYRALQQDSIKRRARTAVLAIQQRMTLLTPREKQLADLVIAGKSSKEIAAELIISVKTVSHHRAHLMSKIGASNVADLVRMSMAAIET